MKQRINSLDTIEMIGDAQNTVVVDTCVILDMFLEDRDRHSIAKDLLEELVRSKKLVVIPFTGLFEGIASFTRIKEHVGHLSFDRNLEGMALEFRPIPIDETFYDRYYSSDLPSLKAGDLLFFAIAKRDGYPLITEDSELYEKSKDAGINVFRIADYLVTSEL